MISAQADRLVREQNAGVGCEFLDETTGKRCGSHFQLQRDHIEPWSHGGSNEWILFTAMASGSPAEPSVNAESTAGDLKIKKPGFDEPGFFI